MTPRQLIAIRDAIRAARAEVLGCLIAFNAMAGEHPGVLRDEDAEKLVNALGVHDVALEVLLVAIDRAEAP